MSTIVAQINLNHSVPPHMETLTFLSQTLTSNQPVIIGMQEPHVNASGMVSNFPDKEMIYYRNTADSVPRAAIYASIHANLVPHPTFMSSDMATAIWSTGDSNITTVMVISLYLDGDAIKKKMPVIPPNFKKCIAYCERNKIQFLILSDLNAHSPWWGEIETNPRGKILEKYIMAHNLSIHNVGERPEVFTYFRENAQTIPDVTLSSGALGRYVSDWQITDVVTSSDHLLMCMKVNFTPAPPTYSRNFRKGDWSKFNQLVGENLLYEPSDNWSAKDLEEKSMNFNKVIAEALDVTHPLKPIKGGFRPFSWYGAFLEGLRIIKKRRYNIWRHDRTPDKYERYVLARRTYQRELSRSRRGAWRDFMCSRQNFAEVARFKQILDRKSLNTLGVIKASDGEPFPEPKDSLNELLRVHFPSCNDYENVTQEISDYKISISNKTEFITTEKVREAIDTFGSYKAPGPDGFAPIVLKFLPSGAISMMCEMYKASFVLGYVPTIWRESSVIFIPKPGKGDYALARSYRPISLMSFVLKTMERVILWRLDSEYFSKQPLNSNQHAFRKGRSTDTALTNMVEYLEKAVINQQYALATFLDIQGAFDNVTTEAITEGLFQKKVDRTLVLWYRACLKNRYITATYKGAQCSKQPVKGTPQGGVLSPVMWNLGFDSFLQLFLNNSQVNVVGFADDSALVTVGPTPHLLFDRMQRALLKVEEWSRDNELHFAADKTVAMFFTRKQVVLRPLWPLSLNGTFIKFEETVRYLGVILDTKLFWTEHVDSKVNNARKLLYKVRNVAGKMWGLNPKMSIWMYKAIVRSMVVFGSLVWARAVEMEYNRTRLRRLQRLALMSMGNFRYSTPTAGLEVITNTLPLWLYVKQEAAMAYLRTREHTILQRGKLQVEDMPRTVGHRQYMDRFLKEIGFTYVPSDGKTLEYKWDRHYSISEDSFKTGEPVREKTYTVYSDGSKSESGHSGAAYIVRNPHGSNDTHDDFYLGKMATVFQAEIYGIYKAAEYLHFRELKDQKIIFYSDSQAAIKALNNNKVTSWQVYNTIERLNWIAKNNVVEIRWVKAHVGHHHNEAADEYAKAGADRTDDPLPNDAPAPAEGVQRGILRAKVEVAWENDWKNCQPCRQTKHFFPTLDLRLSKQLLTGGRKFFSACVQIITGHDPFRVHQSRVDGVDSEVEDEEEVRILRLCRYCDDGQENAFHIFAECEAFGAHRFQVFGNHTLEYPYSQLTYTKLKEFIQNPDLTVFVSYHSND